MRRIRGGSGFGDNLYVQAVCRYFNNELKEPLTVATPYPDLFRKLDLMTVAPFSKTNAQIIAHYTQRKKNHSTSQFMDCCMQAGINRGTELKLDWEYRNGTQSQLIKNKAKGRPILVVQMPRMPMARNDPFGIELLPTEQSLREAVKILTEMTGSYTVLIGKGASLYDINTNYSAVNKTNISELLDIAHVADRFIGQVSSLIPMAESFGKPVLSVFSRKGFTSKNWFISSILPNKVNHYDSSISIMDDDPREKIESRLTKWIESTTLA
jgi:ADP-heptose:LPS heptosyltransferase